MLVQSPRRKMSRDFGVEPARQPQYHRQTKSRARRCRAQCPQTPISVERAADSQQEEAARVDRHRVPYASHSTEREVDVEVVADAATRAPPRSKASLGVTDQRRHPKGPWGKRQERAGRVAATQCQLDSLQSARRLPHLPEHGHALVHPDLVRIV